MISTKFLNAIFLLVLLAGCASSPEINYDEAIKGQTHSKHFFEQDEPTISIKPLPAKESAAPTILPIVLKNPTPIIKPIPIEPIWMLSAGHTVGQDLRAWATKAGWNLVWNMRQDWAVPAQSSFKGDFQTAASSVINTLASNGALIRAQFYTGNKTLVVTGPGVSNQ